ncbi:MAG: DNA polymerase I [Bacteroidales bacterium]|nr:DNA polymerase I [Bacteroidales bacterium]
MQEKTLFLLDAMALVYRAYFAMSKNPPINSKGMNTAGVLGFANSLYDILKNQDPSHIGVAIDTMAPTMRHELYEEYKATRQEMPEDLAASLPYVTKLIEAFNIPLIYKDGYEADDIIGTLAREAETKNFTVYMMTPDKDFGQLVSDKVFMYRPSRSGNSAEVWGVKEVCQKYGINRTEQVIDILGLWGDTSDNIPGVPGIGEKTSGKLIKEYDSIENLLKNTDKLKGKQRENLENYAEQARISRQLATIDQHVPIEFDEEALKRKRPDVEALKELFKELEFRNFAKRVFTDLSLEEANGGKQAGIQGDLFGDAAGEATPAEAGIKTFKRLEDVEHNYTLIETEDAIKDLVAKLKKTKSFCFDTETTSLNAHRAELVGIAFSHRKGEAWFVLLPRDEKTCRQYLEHFKELFEDEKIEKVGQNIKYDINVLHWYDIKIKGKIFDTMVAHYLLQAEQRHNMDYLAETYLDYHPVPIEELIGKKGKNQKNIRTVDKETLKEYAGEDADVTMQLKEILEKELKKYNMIKLFEEMETPLIHVLSAMEVAGVKLDKQAINEISGKLKTQSEKIEQEIQEMAGMKFNINSPKQLGEVLFEKLKITDKPKKTKTKQYSTSEDVLQKLSDKHPIVPKILDYRSVTKLKSTYVDALPELINPRTGRIHTSFNQTVTATGRLSSNNPNLQNIPIRTERGREIRKAFVARDEHHTLLAADYSQIELRLIADISGDSDMIDAFVKGEDIHATTAAKVFNVSASEVTQNMRRSAKTVNFGIIYGISAFGLSERLNIPRREAADIIDAYFKQYPKIKEYMDNTVKFARKNGYVETIMKRRRYLRDINSGNATMRSFAERNAINAPIQGSSADMIKLAMIKIQDYLERKKMHSKMVLQVHDELVFDALKKEVDTLKPVVDDLMRNAIKLQVPIEVEMNTGDNWLVAH